jgi:putative nucleotidyltransferase with HDIG domain
LVVIKCVRILIVVIALESALRPASASQPPAPPPVAADDARAHALGELRKRESDPARIDHALAVEAVMRELAPVVGGNTDEWGLAGLLHDIDLSATRSDLRQHGVVGATLIAELGFSPSIAHAVKAHDDNAGVPRTEPIDHALYCADRAYWAIRSSGLRFPPPEAAAATPAGVIEMLELRGAANRIDERLLKACAALGLTIEDLLRAGLHAMQALAEAKASTSHAPR